jgi:hypothetical protein
MLDFILLISLILFFVLSILMIKGIETLKD